MSFNRKAAPWTAPSIWPFSATSPSATCPRARRRNSDGYDTLSTSRSLARNRSTARRLDLSDPVQMAAAGKVRSEPDPDDFQGEIDRNGALADGEQVRIVVLARPARGVEAPTQRAANAFDFVGHDRFAVAGAAQHDATFEFTSRDGLSHRTDEHRIIDRLGTGRAEVSKFVAEFLQENFDLFLVFKSGVVRADGDFHDVRA